ncbi:hypothetical protein ACH5RR_003406, partial [Cinchona calisaya]
PSRGDEMQHCGGFGFGFDGRFRRIPDLETSPTIKHITNARQISLRSSASSSSSSASPDQNQTPKNPPPPDSPSSSSSSAAVLIGYNEDILLQIFPYLPPKTLLRFQAVSRQWLSIISNPTFRRLHLRVNPIATTSAFFLFRKIDDRAPELNFISPREDYVNSMGNIVSKIKTLFNDSADIMGLHSCNGLVCIKFNFDYDRIEFVVYNPSTNQHRLIPRLGKLVEERFLQTSIVNIAFDLLNPAHYKIVCVLKDKFEHVFRFIVYSSETGVWRETSKTLDMYNEYCYYFERGVLWNGDLHWATELSETFCFNLDNECLRSIMPVLPALHDDCSEVCYFGTSGGKLYLISRSTALKMVFNVFSLRINYSKWDVKHRIDITALSTLYPSVVDEESDFEEEFDFHMLRYLADEKEKTVMLVMSMHRKVISFIVDDMAVKELAEVEPEELAYPWREPSRYRWRDASRYLWREAHQHFETFAYI